MDRRAVLKDIKRDLKAYENFRDERIQDGWMDDAEDWQAMLNFGKEFQGKIIGDKTVKTPACAEKVLAEMYNDNERESAVAYRAVREKRADLDKPMLSKFELTDPEKLSRAQLGKMFPQSKEVEK